MTSVCISTDQLMVALTVVHVLSIPLAPGSSLINPGSQSAANNIKGVQQETERADSDAKLTWAKSMSTLLNIVLLSSFFYFGVLVK